MPRSIIHFQWIFVGDVGSVFRFFYILRFFLGGWDIHVEKLFYFHWISIAPLQRSLYYIYMGHFWAFYSAPLICLLFYW
jgi:hypothetical protein